jgi:hypothetical protein
MSRKQSGQQQSQQDQGGDNALFEHGFSKKKAAKWAASQAVLSHGTKFKLKPP